MIHTIHVSIDVEADAADAAIDFVDRIIDAGVAAVYGDDPDFDDEEMAWTLPDEEVTCE